jgi:hypothetical protein
MNYLGTFLVGYLVMGAVLQIIRVDQARRPVSRTDAVFATIECLAIGAAIALFGTGGGLL